MRVLFSFAGGTGHAEPMVPVAAACRAAGHTVAFAGHAYPVRGRRRGRSTPVSTPPPAPPPPTWHRPGVAAGARSRTRDRADQGGSPPARHRSLAANPHRVGKELKLGVAGLHSARQGDYRVIHHIAEADRRVDVVTIEHRADAYRPHGP